MPANWLQRLVSPAGSQSAPPVPPPAAPPPPKLPHLLLAYEQSLAALNEQNPGTLLAALLLRDQVETARQRETAPTTPVMQQLIRLDEQLRQRVTAVFLPSFSQWRKSVRPPQSHWWWSLDEAAAEKEQEKDFLWHILAVTFFVLTVPLATDIIRRLWAHAPDNVAIVSTLLTLLITASPFTKNGRELMQWLLRRVSFLPTHRHAETMATTAVMAFLLIAGLRFLYLPQLASLYNEQGVAAINNGQLTIARQKLQQAIAINSDLAPSYYNLAAAYETIGRYDEAIRWYQTALDRDLDLAPAYNNLGRLYLLQGAPDKAQTILQSGLTVLQNGPPPADTAEVQADLATRYRLHTHLGQAFYEQGEYARAGEQLRAALALEADGALDSAFFTARPHYYLAQTYEAQQRPPTEILTHWEAALSYLTDDNPAGWQEAIVERIRQLREGMP